MRKLNLVLFTTMVFNENEYAVYKEIDRGTYVAKDKTGDIISVSTSFDIIECDLLAASESEEILVNFD